jgi:hypothetical protein
MNAARPPTPSGHDWRIAAVAFAALLLPLMLWMSRDFGVTWDEVDRQYNGERIWDLYRGVDRGPGVWAEHLYGGLFDVTVVAVQKALPGVDLFVVRHMVNAAFGWLGIVFAGGIVWAAAGPAGALLAMAMLALVPPYMGHSMNNPKDLPFATFATGTLMVLAWLPRTWPYLPPGPAVALGVMIGLTLGVRPGGLLFAAYAGLWLLVTLVLARETDVRRLVTTAVMFGLAALIACVVPIPVWTYLWERPFIGILEAAAAVSQFDWGASVLFNGRSIPAPDLPWTYVPIWMTWTMPPVVLAGAVLSIWSAWRAPASRRIVLGLWFAVLFPIAYVIALDSTLYDGVRHMLFVLPPLVALAALGWWWVVCGTRGAARVAAALVLFAGLAEPLAFQVRNHPNQYVYFSPLVGGPSAMFLRFELDYWGNCLLQAGWRIAEIARASGAPVPVAANPHRPMMLNAMRIPEIYMTDRSRRQHELEVRLMRGPIPSLRELAASPDVRWWVTTADGAPLCAIVPGPQFRRLRQRLERTGAAHLVDPVVGPGL